MLEKAYAKYVSVNLFIKNLNDQSFAIDFSSDFHILSASNDVILSSFLSRVCGSYADMDAGNISEALMDFTGGPHMTIKLSEASGKLWDAMRRAGQSESLMGCGTSGEVKIESLILL